MSICAPCSTAGALAQKRRFTDREEALWRETITTLPILTADEYVVELHALCKGCPCQHKTAPPPPPLSSAEMS